MAIVGEERMRRAKAVARAAAMAGCRMARPRVAMTHGKAVAGCLRVVTGLWISHML